MKETRIPINALRQFAVDLLTAYGVDDEQIQSVTDILMWSELVGRSNFGVIRLPIHLKRVQKGLINCPCEPSFTKFGESFEHLDGDNGFGHHISLLAMNRAIDLARRTGLGMIGVRNSNFFGAGAYYVNEAAQAGMVGVALSNSFPKVVPHGGIAPVFGTNPLAFGAPCAQGRPLMVDMATSALAGSTIREHIRKNRPLPEGLAIDARGAPITDPKKVASGALLPFGGPKGYGLSLMVEILAGVLTGAGVSEGVGSFYKDFERKSDSGHFFLVLDIEHIMSVETYNKRIEALITLIKASNPKSEVLLPGEIRWRNYDINSKEGVVVEAPVKDSLARLANPHGIELPWEA